MIRILFLTSEPSELSRVQVQKELREVQESLERSNLRHRFELRHSPATRMNDFIHWMMTFKPDIVHFSGHGSKDGLWLEDEEGKGILASAASLELMFEQFNNKTSCVVLNACYSRDQAGAIAPYARHVLGTRTAISDKAAIAFSVTFYQALGNGVDVPDAYKLALAPMISADPSSKWSMALDANEAGARLDLRFPAHLPVILGMGCSADKFSAMSRDALNAMSQYEFSEDLYRDFHLRREDYTIHRAEQVPPEPSEWRRLAQQSREIVEKLEQKISGPKVYHFFIRAPICLSMGLGATIGTRHEVVIHHYQEGLGDVCYVPVIDVSAHAVGTQGALVLKLQPDEGRQHTTVNPVDLVRQKAYAALWFSPNRPTGVDKLADVDGATFIDVRSKTPGDIPVNADWLGIAREVNTVLQQLFWHGCSELHLFPSVPVPLAFAIGMGLDVRRHVVVHQWYPKENTYHEVLRLNELGTPEDQ